MTLLRLSKLRWPEDLYLLLLSVVMIIFKKRNILKYFFHPRSGIINPSSKRYNSLSEKKKSFFISTVFMRHDVCAARCKIRGHLKNCSVLNRVLFDNNWNITYKIKWKEQLNTITNNVICWLMWSDWSWFFRCSVGCFRLIISFFIWLLLSVSLYPKVITLTVFHCQSSKNGFVEIFNLKNSTDKHQFTLLNNHFKD